MQIEMRKGDARTLRVALALLDKSAKAAQKAYAAIALSTLAVDELLAVVGSVLQVMGEHADGDFEVVGDVEFTGQQREVMRLALFTFAAKLEKEKEDQISLTIAVDQTDERISEVHDLQDRVIGQLTLEFAGASVQGRVTMREPGALEVDVTDALTRAGAMGGRSRDR